MTKTLIVLGAVTLAIGLVAAGAWAGTAWVQERWESNMTLAPARSAGVSCGASARGTLGPGMMSYRGTGYGYGMMGPGMMGTNWDWDEMPCSEAYSTPGKGDISSLEEVETAVHDYVDRLGYTGLEVTEVMEFERNYYAIVGEQDTGIGAMELLVDKDNGVVRPEPGPNMMWNAKYGMMGRGGGMMGMMGGYASGEMTLSPEEAEEVSQRWLDTNLPGRTPGEADEFYGYYTLHFLNDGQIEGMLSVHGSSGDVWYHSWHGDFVTMIEGHG